MGVPRCCAKKLQDKGEYQICDWPIPDLLRLAQAIEPPFRHSYVQGRRVEFASLRREGLGENRVGGLKRTDIGAWRDLGETECCTHEIAAV